MAGVEVQLTDDFLLMKKSISENYVIPLLMTNVQGGLYFAREAGC